MKGPRNLSYSPLLKERNKVKLLKCFSSTSAFFCKRNILSSHRDNNFCFQKQEEKYKQCAARTNSRGGLPTALPNAHTQGLWTKLLQLLIPDIQDCHFIYFRLKIYERSVMIKTYCYFQAVSGSPAKFGNCPQCLLQNRSRCGGWGTWGNKTLLSILADLCHISHC